MAALRKAVTIAVALWLLVGPTPAALADGDPASDVLLLQDDYIPYEPRLSPPVTNGLTALLKATRRAGYPVKVAIIASPQDLGAVPNLFARPQQYATFLGQEIAFNGRTPLLVVMPQGFGVDQVSSSALRGLPAPGTSSVDALGRSAIEGVVRLARAAGHPVSAPKLSGGGSSSASSPLLIFGVPVLVLGLAGLVMTLRRRPSEPTGARPPAADVHDAANATAADGDPAAPADG